jgi:trimeric autotransporter adhesin
MAVNTSRSAALQLTTDLAQAGAVFNDATRLLDGGLWSTPTDNNGQMNYLSSFLADIHAVLNDVTAEVAEGVGGEISVGGTIYTLTSEDISVLQNVESELNTMITEASLSVGTGASAAAAQAALKAADAAILSDINGDSALHSALANASYAATTGSTDVGFQSLVAGSDSSAAISAATAQGATLAEIGTVFNAAVNVAEGGLNSSNISEFETDMQAVATGLHNILNNASELASIEAGETATAAALTTIHLETLYNQAEYQLNTLDKELSNSSTYNAGARATNDNLLDMIDIVQNDTSLNQAAGGNGTPAATGGFAEVAGFLTGTVTQYQDNQTQTNFWAEFIAEANTINNQLKAVANGTSTMSISSLITEIENYNSYSANFAQSQGGTFFARFGNELTEGTLLADSTTAVKALEGILNGDTGSALSTDEAELLAAGHGFVADANDVSGNNLPAGGGTYVGTSTTVAGATSIAGLATGSIPIGSSTTTGSTTGTGSSTTTSSTTGTGSTTTMEEGMSHSHSYEHMWHHI